MKRKTRKMRGRKTAGYGARKKHRGKGSKGGKGMSGSGKRADQKKTLILKKYGKEYFGKRGFVSRKKKTKAINLDQLMEKLALFIRKGYAQKIEGAIEIDLQKAGYDKLLGRGKVKEKLLIKVKSFSKKAQEKVEQAKGQIIAQEVKIKSKEQEELQKEKQGKGKKREGKARGKNNETGKKEEGEEEEKGSEGKSKKKED
ncbi:hypothetical protein B6U80_01195 [Candidatus Pacearchaeota archaeon ex4484_26]|nr:MAG: hypothetical protein B6U80_01195 [Candidatus Pacearchaeota archaeon ex4484_26]